MQTIREPSVSGSFYPANPSVLKRDIESYIKSANIVHVKGDIKGIISPHAGYMYSGHVAAYGFKAISKSVYDTVIVIAPSHRAFLEGASIMDRGGYKTPLGIVEIDEETAGILLKKGNIITNDIEPHKREHSLEVQLPFLQIALGDFRLIPIIMIGSDVEVCETLSSIIYDVIKDMKKRFLIVGSTDLSHYYSYKEAVQIDSIAVKHIEDFDIQGMIKAVSYTHL
ncbi:MAG: AmmeMemoRadiSam system protein B, partial [Syntrophorhabdaceae bacterium]|nr:AmmeMemoRadiSam system protein B [Syntrophorhabdaceae bacterium]